VSGLVLMTGAAGGGPGSGCRRVAGLLPDRGISVRAFARTQDHRAEQLRQPGAEVAAEDLRETADVESGRRLQPSRQHRYSVQFPGQRCSA
jgi:hypothetical protein